jgi:hypothetical protein
MSATCLSFHAAWACRHSGACCRSGWAIPVEAEVFERLGAHFSLARVRAGIDPQGPLPDGSAGMLRYGRDGRCAFHAAERCAIHAQIGPEAQPLACRQFPRVVLQDARGTLVRLSCYCPTAAQLLVETTSIEAVPAPPGLVLDGRLDGLDARQVLAPLLRPGLLTDTAGYAEWERCSLQMLNAAHGDVGAAIARIADATRRLGRWRPDDGPLASAVVTAFEIASPAAEGDGSDPHDDVVRFGLAASAVPSGLEAPAEPATIEAVWTDVRDLAQHYDRAVRAYAAAHLFGSWIVYSASSLATVVEYVRTSVAVLRVELSRGVIENRGESDEARIREAVRRADRLLIHLADTPALARRIEDHAQLRARSLPALRRHRHALG